MNPGAAEHQVFAQLLQQEHSAVEQLLDILRQEQHALGERNSETLNQSVSSKEAVFQRLQQLSQQREQFLQQRGFSADKSGFTAFMATDPTGNLVQAWEALEATLRECQRQNQLNGTLLESGRQITQEMLSILTGRDFSKHELYNQRGKADAYLGQNTSFKA